MDCAARFIFIVVSMALVAYPDTVIFDANGDSVQYTLKNVGQTNLIYKLKSSDFTNYHFNILEGYLGAGESQSIKITRTKGPPGKSVFFIHYAVAPENSRNPQDGTFVEPLAQIYVDMYAYL